MLRDISGFGPLSRVALFGAGCLMPAVVALGDVDWSSVPVISSGDFQAVTSTGDSAYSGTFPIQIQGVLLDNPGDLLDATPNFLPAVPQNYYNLGGQWQVYVQSVVPGSSSGTGAYMGQNYGNLGFIADTSDNYSNADWLAEVYRVSHDAITGQALHAGDLVELRARTGLFYDGEFNVNEAHFVDPLENFDVVLVQANYGLPAAKSLALSAVKDSSDNFIFDPTRTSGDELYQGTLVKFSEVHLVSPAGDWKPLNYVTVADDTGRTFPLLLGSSALFDVAPTGDFDVTGILSQDDSGGPDPYNNPTYEGGYRLWIDDPSDVVALPEPGCLMVLAGVGVMGVVRRRRI
ncbi:MAG TPA: hypothetical protein VFE58_14760 [Tepidisphaeraceae bacterium]|jgi:hypothetical protein|nr:hypothetical protein [Tepidisphaeraceae bacterium]